MPADRPARPLAWSLVIPVKVLAHAKTRLAPLAGPHRAELALAMAADTVAAGLACPAVDLSAFQGKPLDRDTLRAATAAIMADITGLLAGLRGEQPPAEPFDWAVARRQARRNAREGRAEQPGDSGHPEAAPA